MFEVIPAIDLLGGKVVRLTQGDYAKVDHYDYTPTSLAQKYAAYGAKRIHIVDLDGAKEGKSINSEAIKNIRNAVSCTLELGGGIRTLDQAKFWLDFGIDQIVIGSLFVKNPALALDIIHTLPKKIIAGLDAKGQSIAIEGWVETGATTLTDVMSQLEKTPIHSVIYTDISKDGTLQGPNLDSLKMLTHSTKIPIIASGGIGQDQDIENVYTLYSQGVHGVIVGKALLKGLVNWSYLSSFA